MQLRDRFARLRNRTSIAIVFYLDALKWMGLAPVFGGGLQRDTPAVTKSPWVGDGAKEMAGGRNHGPTPADTSPPKGSTPMHEHTPAELDRVGLEILRELAAERLARGPISHQHAPCAMCGVANSPEWRGPSTKRGLGLICGRCGEWVFDSDADPRDLAASVLANISNRTVHRVKAGLGQLVGLAFYCETDRTEPNPTPWAHQDIAALRRQVQALAASNHLRLPDRYDPRAVVAW